MFELIFQFLPATSKLRNDMWTEGDSNTAIVIDLEDSVQNVLNPSQNDLLKEKGRKNILEFFKKQTHHHRVCLRINSVESSEFQKDLLLLKELYNFVSFQFIFLPKVETQDHLIRTHMLLNQHGIDYGSFVVIIESKKGLNNLLELTKKKTEYKLNYFVWGHHDYNLSLGNWPFIEQDSPLYWETAEHFIRQVEKSGYQYIGGAFSSLDKDQHFKNAALRARSLCNKPMAQVALTFRQTKLLRTIKEQDINETTEYLDSSCVMNLKEKIALAEKVVTAFHSRDSASFVTQENGALFFSPHQFLAATNSYAIINYD